MDWNEEAKKLEVYQEAFKLFNGIQSNAAKLLMECQMNYAGFLDNHPEFKPCFAYALSLIHILLRSRSETIWLGNALLRRSSV